MNTLEQLREHLNTEVTNHRGFEIKEIAKRIKCNNRLSLSVQASSAHYCHPRDNGGYYTKVEIGFPTRCIDKLKEYAEEPKRMTNTVYGYVPIELAAEIIDDFGGIKS